MLCVLLLSFAFCFRCLKEATAAFFDFLRFVWKQPQSVHVDVLEAKGLVSHLFSKPSPYVQVTVDAFAQKSKVS